MADSTNEGSSVSNAASLAGRVGLITGASSGIGAACARRMAEAGMRVVLVARRRERLAELAEQIAAAGGSARVLTCDVTDRGSVASVVGEAVEAEGSIDTLVNNAGVMPLAPVDESSLDDWESMVDVNIKGVLFCTHAALPELKKAAAERGVADVVNISSIAGRRVFPFGSVYCGTKFFVHAFSEGLRSELSKKNVRVITVAPGLVETELHGHIEHDTPKERIKGARQALKWLDPDDIARATVYAVAQPPHVSLNELLIRPSGQEN